MRTYKSVKGWAIAHWASGIIITTVRRTRRGSVEAFKDLYGFSDATWKKSYGAFRAIKVDVSAAAGEVPHILTPKAAAKIKAMAKSGEA